MKKIITILILVVMISCGLLLLTGCKLTVETTDNSVSASVDGETTEKVGGVIDWIKERIDRVFNVEVKTEVKKDSVTVTTGTSEKV